MDPRAEGFYFVVVAGGVYAVGQENHDDFFFEVHPERGAGKTEVAHTVLTKITSTAGFRLRGPVKSQGTFPALAEI